MFQNLFEFVKEYKLELTLKYIRKETNRTIRDYIEDIWVLDKKQTEIRKMCMEVAGTMMRWINNHVLKG